MKPKTYCEKWPVGCRFCDLLLCDGKKETDLYKVTTMNKSGVPGEVLNFEYTHKCDTQPECGECEIAKPMTKYDRLISKTPEELAEWLDDVSKSWYDEGYTKDDESPLMSGYPATANEWIAWLKAPADKEGEG